MGHFDAMFGNEDKKEIILDSVNGFFSKKQAFIKFLKCRLPENVSEWGKFYGF